jgi:hypothetical protein
MRHPKYEEQGFKVVEEADVRAMKPFSRCSFSPVGLLLASRNMACRVRDVSWLRSHGKKERDDGAIE